MKDASHKQDPEGNGNVLPHRPDHTEPSKKKNSYSHKIKSDRDVDLNDNNYVCGLMPLDFVPPHRTTSRDSFHEGCVPKA